MKYDSLQRLLTKKVHFSLIVILLIFVSRGVSEVAYSAQAQKLRILTGIILDAETREPISGCTIRNGSRGSLSSKSGFFLLKEPFITGKIPIGQSISFTALGYHSIRLSLDSLIAHAQSDSLFVEITLAPQLLQLGEVTVAASRRIQNIQEVPVSVNVLDQRAIQERNTTTLDDALRYVPGVSMARDQINIRSASGFALGVGSRTAVLFDGFPLLAADVGDAKFDAFPMMNIEQIEVVKGAGSALYGTGALGGVVNAVTTTPQEQAEIKFRGYAGLYDQPPHSEWKFRDNLQALGGWDASFSQKFGALSVLVSGGTKRDETWIQYNDSFRWNIFSKIGYAFSPKTSLKAIIHAASENRGNYVYWKSLREATLPGNDPLQDKRFISDKLLTGAELQHFFSDSFFGFFRLSRFRTDYAERDKFTGTRLSERSSISDAWNAELQANNIFENVAGTKIHLTWGMNALVNDLPESFVGKYTQRIFSGYAQAELSPLERWIFTLGARLDRESTTDVAQSYTEFSPKFGAVYALNSQTQLRASIGRGFRAPTIGERFAALRFGPFQVQANPNLSAEVSWSYEIGGRTTFSVFSQDWTLDAAGFWNEFTNLIEPRIQADNLQVIFATVPAAHIRGVEAHLTGWLPNKILGFEFSATALEPRNNTTGEPLKYRSAFLWQSRCILPIGAFQLQADYRFQSRFERIDDEIASPNLIPDASARVPIHVLDARIIANMHSIARLPIRLTLNVRNALNYSYTEIIGSLAPFRHFTLQAEALF